MADPIKDLPGEIWKPVVGWEGLYEISSMGRIRSVTRTDPAGIKSGHRGRVLKPTRCPNGYYYVHLSRSARVTTCALHPLVLLAFVGPRAEGMEACHDNGIRTDNRLANLRWGSRADNANDAVVHGTAYMGQRHHWSCLSAEEVKEIRRAFSRGERICDLARRLNRGYCTVWYVAHGRTRKHG
jgi:hypothetical protein